MDDTSVNSLVDPMPLTTHEITIDRAAGFARIRVRGVLDLPSNVAGIQEMMKHPDFHRDIPVLHDLREADLSQLSIDEMERWYDANRARVASRGTAWQAIVVPAGRAHTLVELYKRMGTTGNMTVEVFTEIEPAEAWIRECGAQFNATRGA